ncbi:MAG: DnaJ domain-containing protein [Sulfurospirillum sp.]|nr:DnaJ domain-containing protein [Sulfurospirillum sp.]MBL0703087.1 DnaJ domain-containing protein [Sulfurospirillum sp.]
MKKILGLSIIVFGVFLEVAWLGVCFGSVIIGIVLLLFAPRILFFPFNFFLIIGLSMLGSQKYQNRTDFKYQNFKQTDNTINKYYEMLESQPTDNMETIKKNYRRLIKEYHYDSIISKNLPEDMLKFAKQKTQDLNEAYNAIKEERA